MSNSRSGDKFEKDIPLSGWGKEEFMKDVDERDKNGETLLIRISEIGPVDEIRRLLRAGADTRAVEESGLTPLHCALLGDKEWAAEVLVDADPRNDMGDINLCTPLHEAARRGYVGVVRKLLSGGARTRAQNRWGETPLVVALMHEKQAAAEVIADADVENNLPDKHGFTPLHHAAFVGYTKVARILLFSGAYPHLTGNRIGTPLYFAAENGHDLFVQEIISMCALQNIAIDWKKEMKLVSQDFVQDYVRHMKKCQEEIRLMKETRIGGISYHDIATKDPSSFALRLANDDLRRELLGGDFELSFPNYSQLIADRVDKAEIWKILYEP